ncbi:hypothetical protein D7X33_04830 [Butyricicoccus sp. 1XD8-22]|nr:hypothetical protein D7X33_04830 [Butyricicoccus sp. 1XD8-22]
MRKTYISFWTRSPRPDGWGLRLAGSKKRGKLPRLPSPQEALRDQLRESALRGRERLNAEAFRRSET